MRALSYNIHKGIGGRDRRYDLDRIIRVIEHENPDLLCLQEVTRHARRTRRDDQPKLLQEAFSFVDAVYQMNVHYRVGGYGNLILSRWPILHRHDVSLRLGIRKPRGAQLAVVESPEGKFQIVNWHLGLADRERRWQVEQLLSHTLFRELAEAPTLVLGDFNDWRNRLADAAFTAQGFVALAEPPSKFRTFPAFLPMLSLDKAFQRGLFIREVRPVRTPTSHLASDHLPLVVDFHLHEVRLQ
jgi:endonuclease/exonuclease/phosphatase family metal-dependent hydrolase